MYQLYHVHDSRLFQTNGKFFVKYEGTTMGNSFSPFVANFFVCRFETDILETRFAAFDATECDL